MCLIDFPHINGTFTVTFVVVFTCLFFPNVRPNLKFKITLKAQKKKVPYKQILTLCVTNKW